MPTQISEVVQHFCRAVLRHDEAGLTDGQLLGRFIEQRDEAAVAALVRRHGPMVWGVCRRILHTHHDAEDAFQATFLVLLRKAGSVRNRETVGNWLYGVAHQTALKARAMATKKFARERQVVDMPEPAMSEPDVSRELQAVLDQELSRLPDKYRVAIVLCDLEGMPRKAAAQQLGVPEGTLAGRLTRGRAMLAKRLARSGLAVSGGSLATLLAQQAASGAMPTSVLTSTMKIVTLVATGKTATTGLVSAKVAALTEGVMKAMLISKLKGVAAVVLVLGFIVSGATFLSCRTSAAQGEQPHAATETKATQKQAQPNKALPQAPRPKEKTDLDKLQGTWEVTSFQVRGIELEGPIADQFKAIKFIFKGDQLIYDGKGEDGKPPPPQKIKLDPKKDPKHVDLIPLDAKLKATEGLYDIQGDELKLCLAQNEERPKAIVSNKDTRNVYLILKRIALNGTNDKEQAKEGFTVWGKEAGGLQASLSLRPGEKRVYRHGELITLVVRVRNVGKETVKFEYVRQFLDENLPTVTSADGKTVEQPRLAMLGFHVPMEVSLEPGKEIELESRLPLRYEFRPVNGGEKPTTKERPFFVGTGKVSIQYEQVLGNSSSGSIKLDPALSKLATGKMELEIKSAAPAENEEKGPQKQEPGDQTAKKFWAGMSVNQPLFRAGQNTNLLQFNFALINESDKVLDPKIPGYPRLIVNDKELDLSSIPGVGPRDGRFKALPPGDNLQFGMGAGKFFDKPGVYRVYWQGEDFRSNEVVFRVTK